MKKYIREIEMSGMILIIIGIITSYIWGTKFGVWPCACGIVLWLINFLYKAFHWEAYARENKNNIIILMLAICLLIIQMFFSV